MRIDRNLLHVAAEASAPSEESRPQTEEVRAWVAKLPVGEKDGLLARLIVDTDHAPVTELLQRFLKERDGTAARPGVCAARRTVGQLLRAAEVYAEERRRIEAEKRAEAKARREREAAIARVRYLDEIAGREPKLWAEVDSLTATKQPKSYDHAVRLLVDLRDLDRRKTGGDFGLRLNALRQAHTRKPTFIQRLRTAGL
jgi:hypothetical protein